MTSDDRPSALQKRFAQACMDARNREINGLSEVTAARESAFRCLRDWDRQPPELAEERTKAAVDVFCQIVEEV